MLSYTKDPESGEVEWFDDLSGNVVLARPGENLTFNSSNAARSGFSQGTADNLEELAELMGLPYWYETNDYGRKIAKNWTTTYKRLTTEVPLVIARLGFQGTGSGDRRVVIGKQITNWKKLRRVNHDTGDGPVS